MKKGFKLALLVGFMILGFAGLAKAEIFINFDDPSLFYDDGSGDLEYDASPNGSVWFYGEISKYFDSYSEVTTPDHTTTQDSFLRDDYEVDAYFDSGIDGFEFWWLAPEGATIYGEAYGWDAEGTEFWSSPDEPFTGTGVWQFVDGYGFPGLVYELYLWNNDGEGIAIDDIKLSLPGEQVASAETPEPASMALMGIGLFGLARRFRRKGSF